MQDQSGGTAQRAAPAARPARVVAILGMHRSGTSALTGSLEQHGLFLGRVSTRNRHNPKGNREAAEVQQLNEDVLRASGGAWHTPPPVVTWNDDHRQRAKNLLSGYAGHDVWGFKDPRTLLTLEGWRALVPDLERVGVFRHPARVAASLERRNGMPAAQALGLWQAYNEILVSELRRQPFPLLCFDEDPEALQHKLLAAAGALGLHEHPAEERFFAPELRHAEPAGMVPPGAQALYDELRALAL
jgi:hypothetical protein